MLTTFLAEGMFPFTLALALLMGLLILEVLFALIGGTLLGAGGGEVDGPDLDIDAPDIGDLDIDLDLDGLGIDAVELEIPDLSPEADVDLDAAEPAGGIAAWLGFGKMPALIWLACVLMAFGLIGLVIQYGLMQTIGLMLPASVAAIPAVVGALWFAKQFGTLFARLIPKTQTESVSERHLGRRSGVVSQGTAARGRPAEVRVTDRYGNTQYLRAEPLRDDAKIPQGTPVLVLRHRIDGGYLLVPLPTET